MKIISAVLMLSMYIVLIVLVGTPTSPLWGFGGVYLVAAGILIWRLDNKKCRDSGYRT